MNKEFTPYQESLELKELGFDEPCIYHYKVKSDDPTNHSTIPTFEMNSAFGKNHNQEITRVSAPLKQQVFRWFRDKKLSDSYVYRYQNRTDGGINYGYSIINDYGIEETRFIKENYTSYEEAELACLKKLIEIVKNK